MNTHADKTRENKSQSVADAISQKKSGGESTFQFVDNRPEAIAQRKLQEMANNSPRAMQLTAIQEMANNSPQAKRAAQLQAMADNHSAQQQQPIQKKNNNTGLPDNLKTGMENLSGLSLDDVKVHRNSDKPAQLQAHAYAQGTDIHLASGQEKHLPHEAWHVVQQKQGRVKPTLQMKGKVNVNDDAGLEQEADIMGGKASQFKFTNQNEPHLEQNGSSYQIIQPKLVNEEGGIVKDFSTIESDSRFSQNKKKLAEVLAEKDISYALSPDNAMYFTLRNLKDYMDGKKVPGLSKLEKGDILGGEDKIDGDVKTEQERALKIADTLKRAVDNRKSQEKSEDKGFTMGSIVKEKEGKGDLKFKDEKTQAFSEAFSQTTFYYGTTGEQSKIPIWNIILGKVKKIKEKRLGDKAGAYVAGERNMAFLNKVGGEGDHQMMDMYYGGQEFEAWQMMRNPVIGEYIHKMMGYAGEYDQSESPDTTFRKNFPLGGDEKQWQNRGWSENSKPSNNKMMKGTPKGWEDDMSGTMEISRLIRDGVMKWGGKIVMEHKNVVWDNIFGSRGRFGDTDKEIESFMEVFLKQKSATCNWGKGKLIYTYGGTPEAITKSRVRNDFWFGGPNKDHPEVTVDNEKQFIKNRLDWYNQLEEGNATKRKDIKGLSDTRIAEIDTKIGISKARLDKIKAKHPDNWQEIVREERTGK
jgi:hypothetical protein